MGVEHTPGLVAALGDIVGEELRVIAEYDRDGYNVVYMRDGLESRIDNQADEIHRELVLQGIGREHLERLFQAGRLHCSMHRFDDATAFHFIEEEYTGLFVSLDSDCNVDLNEFAEVIRDHMD